MDERGQSFTLEGVTAGLLVLSSLVFALQVTAVTPLSASTASQHLENQEEAAASGVLGAAATNDSLRTTLLYWNESRDRFHGTTVEDYYVDGEVFETTPLGRMLTRAFNGTGVVFNVRLIYTERVGGTVETERQELLYRGQPSDNAVTASRVVTLYDDDILYDADETLDDAGLTVNETDDDFYLPPAGPSSGVYNVVRVEVVAWRQ